MVGPKTGIKVDRENLIFKSKKKYLDNDDSVVVIKTIGRKIAPNWSKRRRRAHEQMMHTLEIKIMILFWQVCRWLATKMSGF